jgi:hypothetical protein
LELKKQKLNPKALMKYKSKLDHKGFGLRLGLVVIAVHCSAKPKPHMQQQEKGKQKHKQVHFLLHAVARLGEGA